MWIVFVLVAFIRTGGAWDCTALNVNCVGLGEIFSTISLAIDACPITPTEPCVIMIHGGNYPESIVIGKAGSNSSMNPGQIIPFDGEAVTWTTDPIAISSGFDSGAHYWHLWDGGMGGSFTINREIEGTGSDSILTIADSTDIHIGPGVRFQYLVSGTLESCLLLTGFSVDAIVIENIECAVPGPSNAVDYAIHSYLLGPAPPATSDYRVVIRDSILTEASALTTVIHIFDSPWTLVDSNYVTNRASGRFLIQVRLCPHVDIVNNIFADPQNLQGVVMFTSNTGYDCHYHNVSQNTFSLSTPPSLGTIALAGSNSAGDPNFIDIRNNLFEGACCINGGTNLVIAFGCSAGTCLDGTGVMTCNRATTDCLWFAGGSTWVDDNDACAHGGLPKTIVLDQRSPIPYPHYVPQTDAVGLYDEDWFVPLDFNGKQRNVSHPLMGAMDGYFECYGTPTPDGMAICGGHGDCVAPDTCVCLNQDWAGDECELACYGIPASAPESCSSGNGVCESTHTCSCYVPWVGLECAEPGCYGVPATSPEVCNYGNGTCETDGTCTCRSSEYVTIGNNPCVDYSETSEASVRALLMCVSLILIVLLLF